MTHHQITATHQRKQYNNTSTAHHPGKAHNPRDHPPPVHTPSSRPLLNKRAALPPNPPPAPWSYKPPAYEQPLPHTPAPAHAQMTQASPIHIHIRYNLRFPNDPSFIDL